MLAIWIKSGSVMSKAAVIPCLLISTLLFGCSGGAGDAISPSVLSDNQSSSVIPAEELGADKQVNALPRIKPMPVGSSLSSEAYQVTAEATDQEGSELSYQWRQLSGPRIELFDNSSATLTIRAPEVSSLQQLVFELSVTDADDQRTTTQHVVTIIPFLYPFLAEQLAIIGNINHERIRHNRETSAWDSSDIVLQPTQKVLVELISELDDSVIASTMSDNFGNYQFSFPNPTLYPEVKVRLSSAQHFGTGGWIQVLNNTAYDETLGEYQRYTLDSEVFDLTGFADFEAAPTSSDPWVSIGIINFSTTFDGRSAAPFAILDTLTHIKKVLRKEWDDTALFPDLTVYWSAENVSERGDFDKGEVGGTYYRWNEIVLGGKYGDRPQEYNEQVIAHEFGHFFDDIFSANNSVGGMHLISDYLDMSVAFSEGFASAFAALALNDSVYREGNMEKGFSFDVEFQEPQTLGWYNEFTIASILYDLADENNGGLDRMSIGLAGLLDLMRSDFDQYGAKMSIFLFLTHFLEEYPTAAVNIQGLLLENEINPFELDAFGSNERNDAGVSNTLPVYKKIQLNGSSVEVCSIDDFMTLEYNSNKLGARQYVKFNVGEQAAGKKYRIDVLGDFGRDPEIKLFKSTQLLAVARNPNGNSETLEYAFEKGIYVIEIGDFFNLTLPLGKTCFDVSVKSVDATQL